ncbi:MAG: hypothetical protein ABJB47_15815 [Actinomycetota bacterium]
MIIWLNGAFGAGKTTTATLLSELVPASRVFDPETVGYMLMAHPAARSEMTRCADLVVDTAAMGAAAVAQQVAGALPLAGLLAGSTRA